MLVVANPCFVNFSVYVPGVALGKTYCPDWFVFTVLLSFVAGLIISTVVSGITPPFGSLTVPRMTPVVAGLLKKRPRGKKKKIWRPHPMTFPKRFLSPPPTKKKLRKP